MFAACRLSFDATNRGYSLLRRRLLIAVASLVAEHRLQAAWASGVVAHGLGCSVACGIFVPGPGIEPVSPVLAAGFPTSGPPEKTYFSFLCCHNPNGNFTCHSEQ